MITGQGQDKDFSRLNLQGINLQKANLADANFISADLSNANLQEVDLSRAKLVQTQLDKTDFTGATLTGAYIEDWGITRGTKFDGVRCEYVYMRLPTKYNPDPFRKPDNHQEVFADGEFGDFIKPIVDTLDLYHNQNVDPRAIAIAFKQLAENHPDAELEIVAIEKRGSGNVLLRAATSASANRSELSSEYFDNYNEIKALNQELKARLAERDNRIIRLESMVITALQRPSFYAENYHNQGDTMSDKSSNFNISNVGGDVAGIAGGDISGVAGKEMTGVAGGDISGTVAVSIGELEKSDIPEAPKLADLLKQLTAAIESDTNLSDKDKAKALKQVKALAEAGQNPKDEDKKDLADTAITMLKGIVTGLPTAATFVESWNKLLPLITGLFGL
ncbi:MAG TPA: pentapeptide repeat-containing protein [Leptolyngbyaceae cyanobacterium]